MEKIFKRQIGDDIQRIKRRKKKDKKHYPEGEKRIMGKLCK